MLRSAPCGRFPHHRADAGPRDLTHPRQKPSVDNLPVPANTDSTRPVTPISARQPAPPLKHSNLHHSPSQTVDRGSAGQGHQTTDIDHANLAVVPLNQALLLQVGEAASNTWTT